MFGALLLFEEEFIHIVAISFTALILTELTMVALTIRNVSISCIEFIGKLAMCLQFWKSSTVFVEVF